jgi:hypothetical protein
MTTNPEKSNQAGPWDRAGAVLLAALIGAWLIAYVIVAVRAWLWVH